MLEKEKNDRQNQWQKISELEDSLTENTLKAQKKF